MDYELYHHGILGQKWGIRRFQNKDGSLTSAGKKRYGVSDRPRKQEVIVTGNGKPIYKKEKNGSQTSNRPRRRVTHVTGDSKSVYKRDPVSSTKAYKNDSYINPKDAQDIINEYAPENVKELIDSLFDDFNAKEMEAFKKAFEKRVGVPFEYIVSAFGIIETYKSNPEIFDNAVTIDGRTYSKGRMNNFLNQAYYVREQFGLFLNSYNEHIVKQKARKKHTKE